MQVAEAEGEINWERFLFVFIFWKRTSMSEEGCSRSFPLAKEKNPHVSDYLLSTTEGG